MRITTNFIKTFNPLIMVDKGITPALLRTHKVTDTGDSYKIILNKPEDFIYDVGDIILYWKPQNNSYNIISPTLPDEIIQNMLKFQRSDLKKYIEILEQNLAVFCMGKIPNIPMNTVETNQSTSTLRPGELPTNFKFPFNNVVTPNLKFDADNKNVLVFTCKNINITVSCSKCSFISSVADMETCPKCSSQIGITYVPIFNPQYLGYLGTRRCSFISFNPTKYQFSCVHCQVNYESPEIGVNQPYIFNCYDCFTAIRIKVCSINYIEKKDYNLKPGTELPNKGTCKHYKKSFRWFRFSCCNSLYPCDICHNDLANHPVEEAKRMVCGLCSKEQSVKKECDCGMSLNTVHKQFWEGGKGNREKATMSKKDTKKYRK